MKRTYQTCIAFIQTHRAAVIFYSSLFLVWSVLWQLTILQGDDRFFATASGKSGGYQDLQTVYHYTGLTWHRYNGRIADGLGVLWYLFGDTFARFIFAFSNVFLVGMLEAWVSIFTKIPEEKRSLIRLILAAAPLLIVATNTAVAGESVLLAAAQWNYVMPLDLFLVALLPFMYKIAGKHVHPVIWVSSLPLVFIAFLMHEMLMVAVVGALLSLVIHRFSLLRELWFWILALTAFSGALAKLAAPGLWNRVNRSTETSLGEGMSAYRFATVKMASVFSDYPVYYPLLSISMIGLLLVLAVRLNVLQKYYQTYTGRIVVLSTGLSILGWVLISWRHRLQVVALTSEPSRVMTTISAKVLALLVVLTLISLIGIFVISVRTSRASSNPLTTFFYSGASLALIATAVMAHHPYLPLRRAHYVTLLFLAISVVILIVQLVVREDSKEASYNNVAILAITFFVAVAALLTITSQLVQNKIAFSYVEAEIERAKEGETGVIHFPEALPCPELTWYWWPKDAYTTNYKQITTFYGVTGSVQLEVVPQRRSCLEIP